MLVFFKLLTLKFELLRFIKLHIVLMIFPYVFKCAFFNTGLTRLSHRVATPVSGNLEYGLFLKIELGYPSIKRRPYHNFCCEITSVFYKLSKFVIVIPYNFLIFGN